MSIDLDREAVFKALRHYLKLKESGLPRSDIFEDLVSGLHSVDLTGLSDKLDEQLKCKTCYVYFGFLIPKRRDCCLIVIDGKDVQFAKKIAHDHRGQRYLPTLTCDTREIGEWDDKIWLLASNCRKRNL